MNYTKRTASILFKLFLIIMMIDVTIPVSNQDIANANGYMSQDVQFGCGAESTIDEEIEEMEKEGSDGESSSDSSDVPNKDTIKAFYKVAHDEYGLSSELIAGILGNWFQESRINYLAVERFAPPYTKEKAKNATGNYQKTASYNPTGIGLGQWSYTRHRDLMEFARDEGGEWYDNPEMQFKFMFEGDVAGIRALIPMALNSGNDVKYEAYIFHRDWEISADSEEKVRQARGVPAERIHKWMVSEGMDGDKDEDKIREKLGSTSGGGSSSGGASSSSTTNEETVEDYCGGSNGESSDSISPTDDIAEMGEQLEGYWDYSQPKRHTILKHIDNPEPSKETAYADCSSFIYFVLKKAGYKVPNYIWTTHSIKADINGKQEYLKKVAPEDAKRGDIVNWNKGDPSCNHTGILLEDWKGQSTKIVNMGGSGGNHPTRSPVNIGPYNNNFCSEPTEFGRAIKE